MNITEQATSELRKALDGFNQQGAAIHIFSTQGCCGPSIQMDITARLNMNETLVSMYGIDFFIATDLLPQLAEVTIEFGMNGFRLSGLKKSSSSCCG